MQRKHLTFEEPFINVLDKTLNFKNFGLCLSPNSHD